MHIAGGLYRELCCIPPWNAVFGSGGRASAAIAALSKGSTLHTYSEKTVSETPFESIGINLCFKFRPTEIVFSYFHPLSRPSIQPHPNEIKYQQSLHVSGEAVLRFGFLEGDAVVDAQRAVYDPQTWRNPVPFHSNGSSANELAIVLNELELGSATGISNINKAAEHLMDSQNASIIVVKRGVRGAALFERGSEVIFIPAYLSSKVFKIGTGDVFSAIFSYYWAEKGLPAKIAADKASRSVSAYCGSIGLPLEDSLLHRQLPVKSSSLGVVALEGSIATIGQRYTMEEARFVLRELGVDVSSRMLDAPLNKPISSLLILADGFDEEAENLIQQAKATNTPVVLFRESCSQTVGTSAKGVKIKVVDDFVTALYFAAWAAAG